MHASSPSLRAIWSRLTWLAIYSVAMGLLEAICVIYLRRLLPEISSTGEIRLPSLERLRLEVIREASTIVMLVAIAWLAGINLRSRIACFFYAFGIWDIVYYAGLWWLASWPRSWLEWDCLFLIPKPWYGPVLAPVLISAYFVGACLVVHHAEQRAQRLGSLTLLLASQATAAAIWYWSFVEDTAAIMKSGYTGVTYSWPLFALGLVVACAGLAWARLRAASPVGA